MTFADVRLWFSTFALIIVAQMILHGVMQTELDEFDALHALLIGGIVTLLAAIRGQNQ